MDNVYEHFPIGKFSDQVWDFSSVSDDEKLQSIYSDTEAFSLDNGGATAEEIWWNIAADGLESAMDPADFPAKPADFETETAVTSPSGGIDARDKRSAAEESPAPPDKVAQRKVRKTTKNRESATRCRERKQAYTMGLESQVRQLEEENAKLLKEEAEWNKERYKQLTENLIPNRKPPSRITRVLSMEW